MIWRKSRGKAFRHPRPTGATPKERQKYRASCKVFGLEIDTEEEIKDQEALKGMESRRGISSPEPVTGQTVR